jgi:hypothetical protein
MLDGQGAATFGATGLDDEYEMIRDQFRRFAEDRVVPHAHAGTSRTSSSRWRSSRRWASSASSA